MLTISSIAVAPAPQSTPTVRAQPVTPARPINAVARENATGAVVAPQGEAARAQAQAAPPTLSPVTPAQEGQRADGFANGAAPERSGLPLPAAGRDDPRATDAQAMADQEVAQARAAERDKRAREAENADAQRRAEAKSRPGRPGDAAGRSGQKDFPEVKNPAQEAMDAQIKDLLPKMWKASRAAVDMMIGQEAVQAAQERAQRLEELQARLNTRPLANLPPSDAAQNYGAYGVAADTDNRPAPGGQIDQLV